MSEVAVMFGKGKKQYLKICAIFKKLKSVLDKKIKSGQNAEFNTLVLKQLHGLETHLLLVRVGQAEYDEVRHLLFVFVTSHCGGRFVPIVDTNSSGKD